MPRLAWHFFHTLSRLRWCFLRSTHTHNPCEHFYPIDEGSHRFIFSLCLLPSFAAALARSDATQPNIINHERHDRWWTRGRGASDRHPIAAAQWWFRMISSIILINADGFSISQRCGSWKTIFSHRRQKLETFDDCTKFNGFFALQAPDCFCRCRWHKYPQRCLSDCLTTELKWNPEKSERDGERQRLYGKVISRGIKNITNDTWMLLWWCSTSTSSSFRVTFYSSKWK